MMREEMGRMWEDIEENEGGDEEDQGKDKEDEGGDDFISFLR